MFSGKALGTILLCNALLMAVVSYLLQSLGILTPALFVIAGSSCLTFILTPWVSRFAIKAGAMDYPGGRKIHGTPTPRWGGMAIYPAIVIPIVLCAGVYIPNIKAMLLGSSLVLLVGLLDDLFGVRASIRLLVQFVACTFLIMDGVHVTFLPDVWWGIAGQWFITIFWIVGITNAINFLDGMDGLVAGLVAGTSVIFFTLSLLIGNHTMALISAATFGATSMFLSYNFKPARIFLGDGGSNFLGFFLAALCIHGEWARNDPLVSFFIPILTLSVPIYDMVFTTVERIWTGKVRSFREWIEYTGKDHIHHRFEALGLTRTQVVCTIWFLNLGIGLGAITLYEARTYGGVALLALVICVYTIVALLEILGGRRNASSSSS